jgi:hypothetical protein
MWKLILFSESKTKIFNPIVNLKSQTLLITRHTIYLKVSYYSVILNFIKL